MFVGSPVFGKCFQLNACNSSNVSNRNDKRKFCGSEFGLNFNSANKLNIFCMFLSLFMLMFPPKHNLCAYFNNRTYCKLRCNVCMELYVYRPTTFKWVCLNETEEAKPMNSLRLWNYSWLYYYLPSTENRKIFINDWSKKSSFVSHEKFLNLKIWWEFLFNLANEFVHWILSVLSDEKRLALMGDSLAHIKFQT